MKNKTQRKNKAKKQNRPGERPSVWCSPASLLGLISAPFFQGALSILPQTQQHPMEVMGGHGQAIRGAKAEAAALVSCCLS